MVKKIGYNALVEYIENNICWQRGTGSEWNCDALIDCQTLANLTGLAAQAPARQRELFLKGVNIVEIEREN